MSRFILLVVVVLVAAASVLGTMLLMDGRVDAAASEGRIEVERISMRMEETKAELEAELEDIRRKLADERRERQELAASQQRRLKRAIKRATERVRTEGFDAGYSVGFDDGVARATGGGVIVDCPDGVGPGGGPCGWGE